MSDGDRKSGVEEPAAAAGGAAAVAGGAAPDDDADDLVFKALANGTRRRMLDVLKESPRTTGDLCAQFPDLDRTTVLQHLRVLERAELVIGRKVGRERHLTLAPVPIKRIHDRWIGEYARAAVSLLDDLTHD
ncbi:ArsR/SmtB family transcription factor [Tsukamurella ocularis]|uniref:ArsR/SmtB family transcription factor n=1 Tax=Tsukamurella ocularis TaxID=1970234 RepID=UPI0021692891|nr:metalloregulator ArsR/SmtB family transcription factor [Tsukamurella ocularis]MCS3780957.1 DNA-binding transcriptional ArsR family regulator [Tsukamurella ocularis]MCS3786781.1 DNA-binding transcriptional ArsR family regulator [Tsukamurella ocularis]MCS3850623.1 DNA-binding transcriptional ArsR family regulator [Tsukamurella ocularis]